MKFCETLSNFVKLLKFWNFEIFGKHWICKKLNWGNTVCTHKYWQLCTYIIFNFTCVSNANSSDQRPKAAYSVNNYCNHLELIELLNFEEVTFVKLKRNVRGIVMDYLNIVLKNLIWFENFWSRFEGTTGCGLFEICPCFPFQNYPFKNGSTPIPSKWVKILVGF